jgi:hypothetical protein
MPPGVVEAVVERVVAEPEGAVPVAAVLVAVELVAGPGAQEQVGPDLGQDRAQALELGRVAIQELRSAPGLVLPLDRGATPLLAQAHRVELALEAGPALRSVPALLAGRASEPEPEQAPALVRALAPAPRLGPDLALPLDREATPRSAPAHRAEPGLAAGLGHRLAPARSADLASALARRPELPSSLYATKVFTRQTVGSKKRSLRRVKLNLFVTNRPPRT